MEPLATITALSAQMELVNVTMDTILLSIAPNVLKITICIPIAHAVFPTWNAIQTETAQPMPPAYARMALLELDAIPALTISTTIPSASFATLPLLALEMETVQLLEVAIVRRTFPAVTARPVPLVDTRSFVFLALVVRTLLAILTEHAMMVTPMMDLAHATPLSVDPAVIGPH